jgi:hypothetical protein
MTIDYDGIYCTILDQNDEIGKDSINHEIKNYSKVLT